MAEKKTRSTFLTDRSKARTARRGPKVNEDTLAMQARYEEEGYKNIAEILFLMANDSFEDLQSTAKSKGIDSKEYENAFQRASKAVSTAAPYFCKAMRSNVEISTGLNVENVEDAIQKLLDKNK